MQYRAAKGLGRHFSWRASTFGIITIKQLSNVINYGQDYDQNTSQRTHYEHPFFPRGYAQRLSQLIAQLRRKYGIGNHHARNSRHTHSALQAQQPDLFG